MWGIVVKTEYRKSVLKNQKWKNPNSPKILDVWSQRGWLLSSFRLNLFLPHSIFWTLEHWSIFLFRSKCKIQTLEEISSTIRESISPTSPNHSLPSSINRGSPYSETTTSRVPLLLFSTYPLSSFFIFSLNILGIFALKSAFLLVLRSSVFNWEVCILGTCTFIADKSLKTVIFYHTSEILVC